MSTTIISGGSGGSGGSVQITDGVETATVRDTGSSDSLNVAIVDASGNQITSFGGGTEYTEDAVAPADPVTKATGLVRQDTPATLVSTDGDIVAQRGTNYGAAYTQVVTSAGAFVDTFGGGTQYTEGDVDATITGTAALMEGAANTLLPIQGTVADGLLVNLGANNDVTVTGTVTANLAAGTNNIGDVDVLTVPAPLSTTGGGTEATALRVTLANDSTGVVSVDDNGSSLTIDGSVSVTGSVDTELPTAAALADNTANPTVPGVGAFGHVWDGVTWDRTPGTSADGVTVNLGANNDVTVTSISAGDNNIGNIDVLTVPAPLSTSGGGLEATALRVTIATDSTGLVSVDDNGSSLTVDASALQIGDGTNPVVVLAAGADNTLNTENQLVTAAMGYVYDGATWDRLPGNAVDGALVNLGANNDVTVTGSVTADTELPTAAALADDTANPTVPGVGAFGLVWDGVTWDRAPGTSADGALVNLGANNDVTVTGTVTANAGTNLNTSLLALESGGNLAGAATSLAILDDWDETDRAKVNIIAGQAGVAAGAGAVDALTPRVTLASNDPAVTALQLIDNTVSGSELQVDVVAALPTGDNTVGRVKITDGTDVADVFDLANSNPVVVAIVDGAGDQITSFGGGTQYTEDAPAAANPVGNATILVRQDTPAGLTSLDGDNVAQRGTNYGAAYTQIVTSAGAFVDTFGGGTQYTEGDTDASITGTAALMEGAGNTLLPVQGTVADGLLVNLGANNDVTVTSISAGDNNIGNVDVLTVPAPLSTTGGGTEATALRVTLATDSTGVVSVDDNGSSLTVDAAALQIGDGTTPVVVLAAGADNTANTENQLVTAAMGYVYDGATWDRLSGNSVDGALVNLGANNDVTVTGTVTANAGTNLNTSLLALEAGGNLAGAATSLSILDDWDETDRAKVNIIAGQVGIAAGAGAVDALTPRVTLASNDPAVTALQLIDNTVSGSELQVDIVAALPTGDNTVGRVKITDGTDVADVFDLANSNPFVVAVVDGAGDQITSFGGGTQYTEDIAAAADPVGNATILVRKDTPATITTTDGDNIAQRGTNYGAAYTQVVTSAGAFVDTFGGGTQYTEGDVDATITGTAMMMEGAGNALVAAQGTVADGLLVNLGANNDVTVTSISAGDNNIGNVDVLSVIPGTGATNLGKAIAGTPGGTDTGVVALAKVETLDYETTLATDNTYNVLNLTGHRELRTRDHRIITLADCEDHTDYTAFDSDTANKANTTTGNHYFGSQAITFDKANTAANNTRAGVSRTLASAINITDLIGPQGHIGLFVYLNSLTGVSDVFLRLGTNSTNYTEFQWNTAVLTTGHLYLTAALNHTTLPSYPAGTGWDTDAISYIAFGVSFGAETNTLTNIVFDHIHLSNGAIPDLVDLRYDTSNPTLLNSAPAAASVMLGRQMGTGNTGYLPVSVSSLNNRTSLLTLASGSSSCVITSVAGSATAVTLLVARDARLTATFYNDSTAACKLALGTVGASTYTAYIQPSGYYELPAPPYTGQIEGLWDSATGNMRITEIYSY
jgi:hypothetical protein